MRTPFKYLAISLSIAIWKIIINPIDGVGEISTTNNVRVYKNKIEILEELNYPPIGLLYSAFTYFLGFKMFYGEYNDNSSIRISYLY